MEIVPFRPEPNEDELRNLYENSQMLRDNPETTYSEWFAERERRLGKKGPKVNLVKTSDGVIHDFDEMTPDASKEIEENFNF